MLPEAVVESGGVQLAQAAAVGGLPTVADDNTAKRKVCGKCKVDKPWSDYCIKRGKPIYSCSDCHSKYCADRRARISLRAPRPHDKSLLPPKRCADCGETRAATRFSWMFGSKDFLQPRCFSCMAKHNRNTRTRNRARAPPPIATLPPKKCSSCGDHLPATDFSINMNVGDYLEPYCKVCKAADESRRRTDARQYVSTHKAESGCARCPEKDVNLLQLDHVNREEKSYQVSTLLSKATIDAEIAKTQVLCVWCHRLKTHAEVVALHPVLPERRLEGKQHILQWKLAQKHCALCLLGITEATSVCFDCDHIVPEEKSYVIGSIANYSIATLDAELRKCRLLCAKCHWKKSGLQLGFAGFEQYRALVANVL